jgi:hypothetical protein
LGDTPNRARPAPLLRRPRPRRSGSIARAGLESRSRWCLLTFSAVPARRRTSRCPCPSLSPLALLTTTSSNQEGNPQSHRCLWGGASNARRLSRQTLTGSLGDRVDDVIRALRVGARVRVRGRLQSQAEATSRPREDMMDLIVHDVEFLPGPEAPGKKKGEGTIHSLSRAAASQQQIGRVCTDSTLFEDFSPTAHGTGC